MRWEEAYEGWQAQRLTQEQAARLLGICDRTYPIKGHAAIEFL